jgi:3'(2'), 5'-bisphosphate nucleotidase
MKINYKKFLELLPSLHEICKVTGELQIKHHKTNIIFSTKSNQTPVTEVDIQSSLIITNGLKKLTPDIPIVSEEDYDDTRVYDYFWLVDPLDGTRDYINNGDNFCVCISLISDNLPVLGIIYSPISKDFYYSFKNNGAFILKENSNPRKIISQKMSKTNPNKIFTSSSIREKVLEVLAGSIINYEFIKKPSALKFGNIASGAGCFYPRLGPTHEWDTAAGQILVEEAGGIVVDKFMRPLRYNKNKTFLNKEFFVISDPDYDWEPIVNAIFE